MTTIKDVIDKNDGDIVVAVSRKESRELTDPVSRRLWKGNLSDIPLRYQGIEVLETAWAIGEGCYELYVFGPDRFPEMSREEKDAFIEGIEFAKDWGEPVPEDQMNLYEALIQERHDVVKTNIGEIPREDYEDILLQQNGFENQEEVDAEFKAELEQERKFENWKKQQNIDLTAEPTITIVWSESPQLEAGDTFSLSHGNELFGMLDEAAVNEQRHYNTKYRIDYIMDGEPRSYEGMQNLGDGDGPLIGHIEKEYSEIDAGEIVSHFKIHCSLSNLESDTIFSSLPPEKDYYRSFIKDYVISCRKQINQGEFKLPPFPQQENNLPVCEGSEIDR